MQLHAERLQILHCRRFLCMPAQQPHGFEPQPFTGRRQCVQMIGMRTTETDDAFGPCAVCRFQVFDQFEPFVAADQRVDLIEAQDGDFNTGGAEPVQMKVFEGGLG